MTDVTTPSAAPDAPAPTRERLLRAAAGLFRNKGYSGTGLAELLAAAGAPKGSLYHHFPNGKSDLALAAADWASGQMLLLIEASFTPAPTFREGAKTVCYKLAKLFDQQGKWSGCPVSATLFEGPENEAFHQHGVAILPELLVRRELAEGTLIQAHPHRCTPASAYYLLTPQAKAGTSRIERVRDWLLGGVSPRSAG